jgi:predicted enzyme related to lactoylglutathione lyase
VPKTTARPAGSPVWVELSSTDVDESARFYGVVLGLATSEASPAFGGYRDFLQNDSVVAGLMAAQGGDRSAWSVYLRTDDIAATLELVATNGGEVIVPAHAVGDLGSMAVARDPSGASVGLWLAASHPGMALQNEPGTPTWFELHATSAYRETIAFYERAFGWVVGVLSDTEEFRMVTQGEGDDANAGIFDASQVAPAGTPSAWRVYFAVGDADATANTVRAAGGRVLDGPMDTPFGRMSHAIDSTGAAFTFIRLPPAH